MTDYASYNNGTQFEFGHWVDLRDFSSADDFQEYITNHFKECDEKSPLDSPREETMFTDFEGFPESLYGESMNESELEKIFKYIELDIENFDDNDWVNKWNEYCQENRYDDNEIWCFDDDFFNTFFEGRDPMELVRLGSFSELNWSDEYIKFNGYGNLESFNNPENTIDKTALIDWMIENL